MKIATNQERLNELFDADPRSDTAIAAELGVSKQAISAWRKGTRSPKKPLLIMIAKLYNVSIEWLMGFDVDKHESAEEILQRGFNEYYKEHGMPQVAFPPKTPEARIISSGIDKLPKEQRELAIKVMQTVFAQYADFFDEKGDNNDGDET